MSSEPIIKEQRIAMNLTVVGGVVAESELAYDITDHSDVDDPRPQSSDDDHDDDHHGDDLLYHHDEEEEDDDEYELDMWEGQFSLTAPSLDQGLLDSVLSTSCPLYDDDVIASCPAPFAAMSMSTLSTGESSNSALTTSTSSNEDDFRIKPNPPVKNWRRESMASCVMTTFRDISRSKSIHSLSFGTDNDPDFDTQDILVQQLQEQVGVLADNQATNDDRYTRVKQENAALTARIHMLEEHIREIEVRGEERLGEEQKRNRELVARLEREKQLELENYSIRHAALEQEAVRLREENSVLRRELDRLREEKVRVEEQLAEATTLLHREREARRRDEEERREEREHWTREQLGSTQLIQDLSREVEEQRNNAAAARQVDSGHQSVEDGDIYAELPARIADMEIQIKTLKDNNKKLEESNEELQAQMLNKGLDEGRKLLDNSAHNNSLAAEFEAMSENESPAALLGEIAKMRKTLQEQQDLNAHLSGYIDTVLLNIMDKYPELLEIRASK